MMAEFDSSDEEEEDSNGAWFDLEDANNYFTMCTKFKITAKKD